MKTILAILAFAMFFVGVLPFIIPLAALVAKLHSGPQSRILSPNASTTPTQYWPPGCSIAYCYGLPRGVTRL